MNLKRLSGGKVFNFHHLNLVIMHNKPKLVGACTLAAKMHKWFNTSAQKWISMSHSAYANALTAVSLLIKSGICAGSVCEKWLNQGGLCK